MGGAAVVADDAQHGIAILVIAGEGAQFAGHLGRGGISDAGHHRGDGGAQRAALVAVIGQAGGHQQAADIGVAQPQGPELVAQPGDFLRRELRHQHRDFERDGPQPDRMLEGRSVEMPALAAEGHEVQGGEVAGRVVEEHVFRARVGRIDAAARRAGMPLVDGGVVLQAGIGAGPGRLGDLFPQIPGLERFMNLAVDAADQVPLAALQHALEEVVGDPHRVVGVLARDGEISLAVPIGVVGLEIDLGEALLGELDDALDVVLGNHDRARGLDLAPERHVALGIITIVAQGLGLGSVAGGHDEIEVLLREFRARNQRRDLLLLDHLPVDISLDIGMVDIDRDHLGGASRGAAGLDRARRAVADLEEAHQAGGFAAAR